MGEAIRQVLHFRSRKVTTPEAPQRGSTKFSCKPLISIAFPSHCLSHFLESRSKRRDMLTCITQRGSAVFIFRFRVPPFDFLWCPFAFLGSWTSGRLPVDPSVYTVKVRAFRYANATLMFCVGLPMGKPGRAPSY